MKVPKPPVLKIPIPQPPPLKPQKSRSCRIYRVLVIIGIIIVCSMVISVYSYRAVYGCNVTGIKIQGEIQTFGDSVVYDTGVEAIAASSETIIQKIRDAEDDSGVKGILFEIDSLGGSPVAAEEIANAIKGISIPTAGQIRENGTSAAYWIASATNRVFASKLSTVGGIGVTSSYIDYAKQNEKEGITYNQLSTGKYKDLGDPDKTLTDEERRMIERDNQIVNEEFIKTVAANRKLPVENVRALANGSSWLGGAAKEKGLIDEIGGYDAAKAYLEGEIGDTADVCWR